MDMTSVLTSAICLTAAVVLRRELLALGHVVVANLAEFKARLREVDDHWWRR
jgi:hypothetical protein